VNSINWELSVSWKRDFVEWGGYKGEPFRDPEVFDSMRRRICPDCKGSGIKEIPKQIKKTAGGRDEVKSVQTDTDTDDSQALRRPVNRLTSQKQDRWIYVRCEANDRLGRERRKIIDTNRVQRPPYRRQTQHGGG